VCFLVFSVLDSNIYTHLCVSLRFIGPGVTAGRWVGKNWGNMKGMLLVGTNENGIFLLKLGVTRGGMVIFRCEFVYL
jgi:hypothetical protein